jgi:6-phospho-beta-glucosidase
MESKRIAIVGGGSQFSVGLCESLIDYARDRLPGLTVALLDIHEEHLKVVQQYASNLAKAAGVNIKFECTTNRRVAFDGADYILTTFRPGAHLQQDQDESIPPKYGLQGNETVSIGGIFMACRVVPVLQGICADAEAMCPDAWIVNYTNPTQYVADAVRRISSMHIISLCDGFVEDVALLARLLEVDPADITIYPGGSNHGMWIMRFTVKGQEGYPLLKERMSHITQAEIDKLYATPSHFNLSISA